MTDSVLDLLPPTFRYHRVEIPPEQNAFEPLARAIAGLVGASADYSCHWPPTAEDRDAGCTRSAEEVRALAFHPANEAALSLLDGALGRNNLQYPEIVDKAFAEMLNMDKRRLLALLLRLRSELFAAEGQLDLTVAEVLRSLRSFNLQMRGDCLVVDTLVNSICQQVNLIHARTLFDQPLSAVQSRQILEALLACRSAADAYEQSLLVEVAWTLRCRTVELPAEGPTNDVIEAIVESICARPAGSLQEAVDYWTPDRLAKQRERLRSAIHHLVDGHPHAYDRSDCLRRSATHIVDQLAQLPQQFGKIFRAAIFFGLFWS